MDKEELIIKIIEFMNESVENTGYQISAVLFSFVPAHTKKHLNHPDENIPDAKGLENIKNKYNVTNEEIFSALKTALSRNLIEYGVNRYYEFDGLRLTSAGQDIAITKKLTSKNKLKKFLENPITWYIIVPILIAIIGIIKWGTIWTTISKSK